MSVQPYWTSRDGRHCLYLGDCLDVLPGMEPGSVDSVVCDPPYGLEFMGKSWDHGVPGESFWTAALRVAKPGAHLLAFGGTRTYHRLACAIEDAGWEIRDCVMWVYAAGFPKSLDVSKAIDKAAGAEREVAPGRHGRVARTVGIAGNDGRCMTCGKGRGGQPGNCQCPKRTAPATEAARQWSGWGTALKPAWEPIIVARKPLVGTVAANVLRYGTGAVNVDGCRLNPGESVPGGGQSKRGASGGGIYGDGIAPACAQPHTLGRWPANLIHDGSDEVVGLFPERDGAVSNGSRGHGMLGTSTFAIHDRPQQPGRADTGSAARFFYCAKASKADREEGNDHPTVKPTALMRYLCRLVTPPGGKILDPFCGSGSTGKAAILEGFQFIGIEREPKYADIAVRRMERELSQPHLPGLAPHEAGDVVRGLFGE